MIVTRRRFNEIKELSDLRSESIKALVGVLGETINKRRDLRTERDLAERHLSLAESALDYKEAVIEGLQDDLYRMHEHMLYVREVMTDLP